MVKEREGKKAASRFKIRQWARQKKKRGRKIVETMTDTVERKGNEMLQLLSLMGDSDTGGRVPMMDVVQPEAWLRFE